MTQKAYRYRFYPTFELIVFLSKTFGCCRFIYNYFLAKKQEHYEKHKKTLSYTECSRMLAELKKTKEWLKEISSVALQQSLRHLEVAFERFFQKKGAFPKFKKKIYEQKATFMRNAFTFKEGELWLAKCTAPLKIRWSRRFQGEPSSITVTLDQRGRYYISFLVEEVIQPLSAVQKTVGLDLGLINCVTTSNGEKIKPGHFLQKQLKRLRRRQKAFSRKIKGSINFHKARKAIGRLCGKIQESRTDYLHKVSTQLVNENQVICIEDLAVKNMIKNKHLSRSIADAGWGRLVQFLKYKSDWYGRKLVQIGRFFPSSKQCCHCKAIHHELKLSERLWRCVHCHREHDRDVAAAINIEEEGLRQVNWSTVGHTGLEACGANVRPTWATSGSLL
jgi:putative transposase